jgi:hypothetical protein
VNGVQRSVVHIPRPAICAHFTDHLSDRFVLTCTLFEMNKLPVSMVVSPFVETANNGLLRRLKQISKYQGLP